ncbi:hypothetical protein BD779DRAFT_1673608 [Infundibulicybe gibba]|nr:hypothetical protein BD779DRAFT_1673608 [Infundibulicybe gibba]
MASANGHYDETLLAAAPKATKEMLQEGYNPDLLAANRAKPQQAPFINSSNPELGLKEQNGYAARTARPVPFWRTRKGMIIIFLVVIAVLAAIIGGAVGGSKKKKANPDSEQGLGAPASSASNPSSSLAFGGLFSSITAASTSAPDPGASNPAGALSGLGNIGQPPATQQQGAQPTSQQQGAQPTPQSNPQPAQAAGPGL